MQSPYLDQVIACATEIREKLGDLVLGAEPTRDAHLGECDRDAALARDHYSFANVDKFVTEHLHLDLAVDFGQEVLRGKAELRMRRLDAGAGEIVLDTRDLAIDSVTVATGSAAPSVVEFALGDTDDYRRFDLRGETGGTPGSWVWRGGAGYRWLSGFDLAGGQGSLQGVWGDVEVARWFRPPRRKAYHPV